MWVASHLAARMDLQPTARHRQPKGLEPSVAILGLMASTACDICQDNASSRGRQGSIFEVACTPTVTPIMIMTNVLKTSITKKDLCDVACIGKLTSTMWKACHETVEVNQVHRR